MIDSRAMPCDVSVTEPAIRPSNKRPTSVPVMRAVHYIEIRKSFRSDSTPPSVRSSVRSVPRPSTSHTSYLSVYRLISYLLNAAVELKPTDNKPVVGGVEIVRCLPVCLSTTVDGSDWMYARPALYVDRVDDCKQESHAF